MMSEGNKWTIKFTPEGHRIAYVYIGHHHKILLKWNGSSMSLVCMVANRSCLFKYTDMNHEISKKNVLDGILEMLCLPQIDDEAFHWVVSGIIIPRIITRGNVGEQKS